MPPTHFTLTAPPTTDIWQVPPTTHRFSAPTARPSHGPLRSLRRARLTVTLPPRDRLITYDQGGLLLTVKPSSDSIITASNDDNDDDAHPAAATDTKWLKTGLEVFRGEVWASTVGCDRWADASIVPLSFFAGAEGEARATVEVEREEGKTVWVYLRVAGGERVPLREVGWLGADEEGWEVSVAAYAARPLEAPEGREGEGEGLVVGFEGLEVEWA